jgi:arylsulfatase A-like enzyme
VIDTLRADYISCYGGRPNTPSIDSLARDGVLFRQMRCHTPTTGPSHATLFTGLLPLDHMVRKNSQILDQQLTTVAEMLQEQGYNTAGIVSLGALKSKFGFNQGFDTYDEDFPSQWFRVGGEITESAQRWLKTGASEPYFMFVHYSDPHEPYTPPGLDYPRITVSLNGEVVGEALANGTSQRFKVKLQPGQNELQLSLAEGSATAGKLIFRQMRPLDPMVEAKLGTGWPEPPGSEVQREQSPNLPATLQILNKKMKTHSYQLRMMIIEGLPTRQIRKRYLKEVKYCDIQLGRFLDTLRESESWERSIIIFTSDHGEGLGHHGLIAHSHRLYDSLLHVPMIMVAPGLLPAGVEVDDSVGHIDLLPTLLDLLGIEPSYPGRGTSLVGLAHGKKINRTDAVLGMTFRPFAKRELRSLVQEGFKYIRNEKSGLEELYNLAADPKELEDLSTADEQRRAAMRTFLDTELQKPPLVQLAGPTNSQLDDEEIDQLEALGYVER